MHFWTLFRSRMPALFAGFLLTWTVVTTLPVAAQTEIAPDAIYNTAAIDTIIAQGEQLEAERRWSDALQYYERAIRENPNDPRLEERLAAVRMRLDVSRRYADTSFVTNLRNIRQRDALALYSETLTKIQTHYVQSVTWRTIYLHGLNTLVAALEDPKFLAANVPNLATTQLQGFRDDFFPQAQRYRVDDRRGAYNAAAYCAYVVEQKLHVPQTAAILEFTSGAMSALDEYSSFLTGNQLDEVFSQIEGNFVGLGIELKTEENALKIVSVISGGPADRAGIVAGDQIVGVDGKSTLEVSTDQAADMLKGEEGSLVSIVVQRTSGEKVSMRLARQRVEVPSVEKVALIDREAAIGYFKLTSFQKTTSRDVDAALWQLHREGMRVLVIDLRGNPGGLLSSSVEIADKFLKDGGIVSTRGRVASEDYDYRAHQVGTWSLPLIVLIDGDSASASEIFAGAIHDQHRGVLVGERSFGKGSVQGIFPLQSANAGVRLTTAKFYSPSGQPISKRGVAPDVVVTSAAKPLDSGERLAGDEDLVLKAGLQVAREQLSQR